MPIESFPQYRPGDQPSASELNRMTKVVESLTTFTAPESNNDATGQHLRSPDITRLLARHYRPLRLGVLLGRGRGQRLRRDRHRGHRHVRHDDR